MHNYGSFYPTVLGVCSRAENKAIVGQSTVYPHTAPPPPTVILSYISRSAPENTKHRDCQVDAATLILHVTGEKYIQSHGYVASPFQPLCIVPKHTFFIYCLWTTANLHTRWEKIPQTISFIGSLRVCRFTISPLVLISVSLALTAVASAWLWFSWRWVFLNSSGEQCLEEVWLVESL